LSPEAPPLERLRELINGYQVSQAIHVAASLGIADLVAEGPRGVDDLATLSGADGRSLYRLLRALASIGIFTEEAGRRFSQSELSDLLRQEADQTLYGWAAFIGRPPYWQAWGHLLHGVRTGENAFRHVHGEDIWEYRAREPAERAPFDRAMTDITLGTNRSLLDAYDFGRFSTVIDVAGGRGALLAALLAAYPNMHGVLFDQPDVVEGVAAELEPALSDRLRVVGGSFFESVPEGGDAYLLKAIIHDWEDAEALSILTACRRAAQPGATVLVIERELGPPNTDPRPKFADLNMLVNPGGCERTEAEYAGLLESAGFRVVGETRSSSGWHLFEGAAE
jgi:O-methyltransferase/methyltransferase family protein